MPSFTDRLGQKWYLELDLFKAMKLEDHEFPGIGKIKFFPPTENLLNLLSETAVSFGMIWFLCQDQIKGRTYATNSSDARTPIANEEDFARCFNGETVDSSRVALFEELGNFFPQMKITLSRLIERYSSLKKIVDSKVADKIAIEMSDQRMIDLVEEQWEKAPWKQTPKQTPWIEEPLPPAMQEALNKME